MVRFFKYFTLKKESVNFQVPVQLAEPNLLTYDDYVKISSLFKYTVETVYSAAGTNHAIGKFPPIEVNGLRITRDTSQMFYDDYLEVSFKDTPKTRLARIQRGVHQDITETFYQPSAKILIQETFKKLLDDLQKKKDEEQRVVERRIKALTEKYVSSSNE